MCTPQADKSICSILKCTLLATFLQLNVVQNGNATTDDRLLTDIIRPYASYSFTHDNNVLRLSEDAGDSIRLRNDQRSDNIIRYEGGLQFEKEISRQRLSAHIKLSRNKFSSFDELNHDSRDLMVKWAWRYGNQVSGNVGASNVRSLTPFVDFHELVLNLRTQTRQFADVSWLLHPRWRINGGVSRYKVEYGLPVQRFATRGDNILETGIDYLSPTGSSIGFQLRHIAGQFPFIQQIETVPFSNDYQQQELLGKVDWHLSAKTRLQFLGGHVNRKHESFSGRNFNGPSARFIMHWQATSKTRLIINAWREEAPYDDLTTNFSINQGISLVPTWTATEKITLEAMLKREARNFSRSGLVVAGVSNSSQATRKDSFAYVMLAIAYAPINSLQLKASIYRDRKVTNSPFDAYSANGAMVTMSYHF